MVEERSVVKEPLVVLDEEVRFGEVLLQLLRSLKGSQLPLSPHVSAGSKLPLKAGHAADAEPDGETRTGDELDADEVEGKLAEGDASEGKLAEGDASEGKLAEGDASEGKLIANVNATPRAFGMPSQPSPSQALSFTGPRAFGMPVKENTTAQHEHETLPMKCPRSLTVDRVARARRANEVTRAGTVEIPSGTEEISSGTEEISSGTEETPSDSPALHELSV